MNNACGLDTAYQGEIRPRADGAQSEGALLQSRSSVRCLQITSIHASLQCNLGFESCVSLLLRIIEEPPGERIRCGNFDRKPPLIDAPRKEE